MIFFIELYCNLKRYTLHFLKFFFEKGNTSKLQQAHVNKLRRLLARLHAAAVLEDMQFPGSGLHKLSGNYEGFHSVEVNGNYRLIFRFQNGNVYDVDYLDYH